MIYFQLGLIVVLGFFLDNVSVKSMSDDRKRRIYIIICLTLSWLMAALRNIDWVASLHLDAGGYAYIFNINQMSSWNDLFSNFANRYLHGFSESDIGYYFLNKVIGIFTDDYNVFSLFADLIFFIPFGLLLYKYTTRVRQVIIAFVFYVALIQIHLISGARQMLALGLDILAVQNAIDNNKRNAIALLLMGMTIHFSSFIMLAPLILIFIDLKPIYLKLMHIASFLAFPVVYMFPNQVIVFLGNAVGMEKYANYGADAIRGGADMFIFLIGLLSVFCFFSFSLKCLGQNGIYRKFYTMVPLFTFFAPLINSNGSMIRICLYFYIYLVLLIPYGLDYRISKSSQNLAYAIVIGVLSFLILRGGAMDYHFMWQPI